MKTRCFLLMLVMVATGALAQESLRYGGQIVDESGMPLGGVYPITFSLHPSARSSKVTWSEKHWVAVDFGEYQVLLGSSSPLPPEKQRKKLWLSVSVEGVGELFREKLDGVVSPVSEVPEPPEASFVESSRYAVTSNHAKNAERLQDLSVDEILRKAADQKKPVRVSTVRRPGDPVGGPGGRPYQEHCPKGYVMTGIRGNAATYVNSMQIICSPLEQ